MFHELKIDPEFETVVDAMSDEEFNLLEEKIMEDKRIINPIVTWKGVIVDGHNRYKIAKKHPEIPFTVTEMEFECRIAVCVWICKTHLARRHLNEKKRRYLIGKQYQEEKRLEKFYGNQYTSKSQYGLAQAEPNHIDHGTRTIVAKENGVSNSYVERADYYARGLDAAEQAVPGIKKDIISGKVDASFKEVADLRNLPEEERKFAIEKLKLPFNMRNKEPKDVEVKKNIKKDEAMKPIEVKEDKETPFEESLLVTFSGITNTFVVTANNLFARFPKLKSVSKYRKHILKELENTRQYIDDTERYLNDEEQPL